MFKFIQVTAPYVVFTLSIGLGILQLVWFIYIVKEWYSRKEPFIMLLYDLLMYFLQLIICALIVYFCLDTFM